MEVPSLVWIFRIINHTPHHAKRVYLLSRKVYSFQGKEILFYRLSTRHARLVRPNSEVSNSTFQSKRKDDNVVLPDYENLNSMLFCLTDVIHQTLLLTLIPAECPNDIFHIALPLACLLFTIRSHDHCHLIIVEQIVHCTSCCVSIVSTAPILYTNCFCASNVYPVIGWQR